MVPVKVIDKGLKPYKQVLDLQVELYTGNISKKENAQPTTNYLILCEHQPVFTLGKSGKRENIIATDEELNAEFYQTNRGGDVTFHGPGQLVVYPILDLDTFKIGLAHYIELLEEAIIQSIAPYGLKGERIADAAGIWLRDAKGDRKIGAIGVKASKSVVMHGIAININTDLSYFDKIVPCGIKDKGVTSLEKEIGKQTSLEDYKKNFLAAFKKVFGAELISD